MTRGLVQEELRRITRNAAWTDIFFSENKSKVQAVNADMNRIHHEWDIVVLVSDDMIPQIKGYDDVIRNMMAARFPDTNGILWFNDGFQKDNLNTLSILGRRMYDSFGYIYHPAYKSLFCDTEFTDLCRASLKDMCLYVDYPIIRHEHPGNGLSASDDLYVKNQLHWNEDMLTYISRKTYASDWSILIATIPGREESLQRLISSIHEKRGRLCPELRVEVLVAFDNREATIGAKRQTLLDKARGKYLSFIDDDDEITDAYFEDGLACIGQNYHVSRLRGQIRQYTFTHSIENSLDQPMARGDVFVRPPNHLNVMMSDIAKLIRFRDVTYGEDLDWTIRLATRGFLTHEYRSDDSRIHYIYNSRPLNPGVLESQRTTSYETMLASILGTPAPKAPTGKLPGLRLGSSGFVST
jgi:glycosyltransferase involved in cell wall biosynthesis